MQAEIPWSPNEKLEDRRPRAGAAQFPLPAGVIGLKKVPGSADAPIMVEAPRSIAQGRAQLSSDAAADELFVENA
jgi:hypothetical protein